MASDIPVLIDKLAAPFTLLAVILSGTFILFWALHPLWRQSGSGKRLLLAVTSVGMLAFVGLLRRFDYEDAADVLVLPTWITVSVTLFLLLRGMLVGADPSPNESADDNRQLPWL